MQVVLPYPHCRPQRRAHRQRLSSSLDSDLDLRTAGQVLGHSQLALTARYSHILADRKLVAATRVDEALFGSVARGPEFVAIR
jgi:hypothetical protein